MDCVKKSLVSSFVVGTIADAVFAVMWFLTSARVIQGCDPVLSAWNEKPGTGGAVLHMDL